MTEQDIKDLCREFGWTGVGADHRVEDWLRSRLERAEVADKRQAQLSPHATRPSDFGLPESMDV